LHDLSCDRRVMLRLELGGGKIAERFEQPLRVEPRDAVERRVLNLVTEVSRYVGSWRTR
jgi:hypothetical protein